MRKVLCLIVAAVLLLGLSLPAAASDKLPLQAAHKVSMKSTFTEQFNGSEVQLWQIETAQPAVSAELNALAKTYADQLSPTLGRPSGDDFSRLDVNIHHYRTGLTWMSFMVQSRYVLNKVTKDVRFTTRTYDMSTGQRIMLTDIFPANSEAWGILQQAVAEQINAYYPDLAANPDAFAAATSRSSIARMDFTLHGMSLMLHLHAADFYPGKQQLIQITLYYPDLRAYMLPEAQKQTDNLTYYNTVALTYDDGPSGWVTREMLNVLMRTGERATFFIVADRLLGRGHYAQREHDEGHSIASHTYNHELASQSTPERLLAMVQKVNQLHLEYFGIAPTYARAPGGQWKPMAKAGVGWPLIQWTAEARDWEGDGGRDPFETYYQIIGLAKDGGIILMHDMKKNSIEASQMIIETMQERGFIFLTVDELFAKDGVVLQPDTAYWRCQNGVTTDD